MAAPSNEQSKVEIVIEREDLDDIFGHLKRNPQEFLMVDYARGVIARRRYAQAMAAKGVEVTSDKTSLWPDALDHNLKGIDQWHLVSRTNRLIRPLCAIDRVFMHARELKALSIGPRTEMELLNLVAQGFLPENIRGLDLFSTSPWIDVGNMHSMPYPDNSFDVVIAGWVLVYSSDPDQACREMLRVAGDKGIIALGATRLPEERWAAEGNGRTRKHYPGVWDILEMFGTAVRNVYVQHESESADEEGRTIVIFDVKKS
jgi:SAM-dependent methyltransferase